MSEQLDFLWPIKCCFNLGQVPLEDTRYSYGIKFPPRSMVFYMVPNSFLKVWEISVLIQSTFPWWHCGILCLVRMECMSLSHSQWTEHTCLLGSSWQPVWQARLLLGSSFYIWSNWANIVTEGVWLFEGNSNTSQSIRCCVEHRISP